jgi:hypothetical protein
MVVVESSMAGGRKEVALAAIALLSAVLQAHGSITDIVSPAMWSRAVRAVGVGVEAATSPACMVPLLVSAAAPGAAPLEKESFLSVWPQCCPLFAACKAPAGAVCCLLPDTRCPVLFPLPACRRRALSCWRSLGSCTPPCGRALMHRTQPRCSCGWRSSAATPGQVRLGGCLVSS